MVAVRLTPSSIEMDASSDNGETVASALEKPAPSQGFDLEITSLIASAVAKVEAQICDEAESREPVIVVPHARIKRLHHARGMAVEKIASDCVSIVDDCEGTWATSSSEVEESKPEVPDQVWIFDSDDECEMEEYAVLDTIQEEDEAEEGMEEVQRLDVHEGRHENLWQAAAAPEEDDFGELMLFYDPAAHPPPSPLDWLSRALCCASRAARRSATPIRPLSHNTFLERYPPPHHNKRDRMCLDHHPPPHHHHGSADLEQDPPLHGTSRYIDIELEEDPPLHGTSRYIDLQQDPCSLPTHLMALGDALLYYNPDEAAPRTLMSTPVPTLGAAPTAEERRRAATSLQRIVRGRMVRASSRAGFDLVRAQEVVLRRGGQALPEEDEHVRLLGAGRGAGKGGLPRTRSWGALEATGAALHGLGTGAWSALKTATRGVGGWMSLNRPLSDLEEHAHGAKPMRTHQITAYDDIALRV